MYKPKKAPIQILSIMLLITLALPLTAFAKSAKVDVCHWDAEQGTFKLINISEKAIAFETRWCSS